MAPLIISGIVSLAGNVVDAWKAHAESKAAAQTAKGPDFQEALKTAATQLVSAASQQEAQAFSAQLDSLSRQILQSPEVQSATSSGSGDLNLKVSPTGELFLAQQTGLKRVTLSPEVQQSVERISALLAAKGAGTTAGVTTAVNGRFPTRVNFTAI